jgi:hypothetical protein
LGINNIHPRDKRIIDVDLIEILNEIPLHLPSA